MSSTEHKDEGLATAGQLIKKIESASMALRKVLGDRAAVSVENLTEVFAAIRRIAVDPQYGAAGDSSELQSTLSEYRRLLEEFKARLPQFQGRLLAERARLAQRGSHSAAVENW